MPTQVSSQIPTYSSEVDDLSHELMGYIADKWTLLVFEELDVQGRRFGDLRKAVPGISQKMLTQTLRQMERVGLVKRTVHPVIPPRVEYQHTALGLSLGPTICLLWDWVEANASAMAAAKDQFDRAAQEERERSDHGTTSPWRP
jgi:DNA-binding HxlR family transcriptional regulator